MNVPCWRSDGFEADDIIGTLAQRAEQAAIETFMVTPDKDFGQLVTEHTKIYKPGRQGADTEILGVPEVCERWGIERTRAGDRHARAHGRRRDNIPGVTGCRQKTATKLIQQFGNVGNADAHADQLKGKLKEKSKEPAEDAHPLQEARHHHLRCARAAKLADLACSRR